MKSKIISSVALILVIAFYATVIASADSHVKIGIEEETEVSTSKLIEEETYYFDDANYLINGLAVHIDSITLKQEKKPAGYSVFVTYDVENQNSSEATFAFSSFNNNCFEFDGVTATLTATATWSNTHVTKFRLDGNGKSESLIGDFYAQSMEYPKTINGVTYGPIDISELYEGQSIVITLSMEGYVGDSQENLVAAFNIEL